MGFAKKLFNTGLLIGGTLGALAVYNKITEALAGELNTVLSGEERRYPWKYGDMFYEVKGARDAKPLLLVHGFGPGASSYEWRKNIDVLAEHYRVYAVDLLGFGLSDRQDIDYDAELYTDLLNDFLREVVEQPAIVVAHGLSCGYIIACAFRRPQLFERVVLVSPDPELLQEHFPTPASAALKLLLRTPIVGEFIYNMLTSRQAIRNYYDKEGYHNLGLLTDELVEYISTNAHQPESRYAAAAHVSNHLTMDVREPFARLQVPTIAIWGREGVLTPTEVAAEFKRVNPLVDVRIFDKARYHVQEEQAIQFNNLLREFANVNTNSSARR
ncbi:MAG TPA: alpha/beta fold hydrolase [Ktedonobacteraceae bacterium]|jgi:pimeloyl-ACP methyl ester carboxylesterase|nr:alpha/beta fold hydrolase [Ktedonobacteraceae bacterium]